MGIFKLTFTPDYSRSVAPCPITQIAGDDLIARRPKSSKGRGGGIYHIQIGNDRLEFQRPIDLLVHLHDKGLGARRISVDAPYQHTTWGSVDEALAWCVAEKTGYVLDCPRRMFIHKPMDGYWHTSYCVNLRIMLEIGGTLVSHWHRPGNSSKYYGHSGFTVKYRICYSNPRDGLLAALFTSPVDDRNPIVASAVNEYRRTMSSANLDNLKTAFALAYSDDVQRYVEAKAHHYSWNEMGFRRNG